MGRRNRKRFLSAGIFTVLFISSITILPGCKNQETAKLSAPSIPLYPQWDGKAGDTNQANFWAGKGNGKFGAYCGSELQVSVRSGDFLLTYSTLHGTFRIAFRAGADSLLHVGLRPDDRVTEAFLQRGIINVNVSQNTSWQSNSVTLFAWPGSDSLAWDQVITLDAESTPIHLIRDGKVLPAVEQLPAPAQNPNPPAPATPATTPIPTPAPTATVTPDSCVVTTEADSGAGSLRQVLANSPCCTNITFASSVNSITLAGTQLEIPGTCTNLTIDGGSGVTISGNYASRVFAVKPNATVLFENLHITKGMAIGITPEDESGGGGIFNQGNLTIGTGTIISENKADSGGGIRNRTSGQLLVKGIVRENTATYGGGISNSGGSTVSVEGLVKGNIASESGGGLVISSGGPHTIAGTVTENRALSLGGGGIIHIHSTLIVSGDVTLNQTDGADSVGGGIYTLSGTLILRGTVSGNRASYGGGLGVELDSTVNLEPGNLIENNEASASGGGIYSPLIGISFPNISGTPVGSGNTPSNCDGEGCPEGW